MGALRQQEAIVREKIKALEDEKKSTKSLVEQYQQMSKALTLAAEKANDENDINEINAKKKAGQAKNQQKSDAAYLDNKIRATRKLYKEFKTMLSEYLEKIGPVQDGSGGHLSVLLQHLWNVYQQKGDEYAELSDLPFDV